jgi:hypothetical protein
MLRMLQIGRVSKNDCSRLLAMSRGHEHKQLTLEESHASRAVAIFLGVLRVYCWERPAAYLDQDKQQTVTSPPFPAVAEPLVLVSIDESHRRKQ